MYELSLENKLHLADVNHENISSTKRQSHNSCKMQWRCTSIIMNDVDVPFHLQKHISSTHITTTIIALKLFVRFLISKGINIKTFKLSQINDTVVGNYCDYLNKKYESNYSYNDKLKVLRTFFNYLIDKEDYNLKNV